MRFILKKQYMIASVLLLAGILFPYDSVAQATIESTTVSYSNQQINRYETTIEYINEMRASQSLQQLKPDGALQIEAERRAQYIAESNKFSHFEKNGDTFYSSLVSQNNAPEVACENLSVQFSSNPATAFTGWMKSSEHYACMSDSRMGSYGFSSIGMKHEDGTIYKYISVLVLGGSNE